jgi:hypothetical protein
MELIARHEVASAFERPHASMLSWSSTETGQRVDLVAVAEGTGDVGLPHGDALLRFASACGGTDDAELIAARAALVAETDAAFMVDAAAVAANCEMMTRLADGTGAVLTEERRAASRIETMGAGNAMVGRRYRRSSGGRLGAVVLGSSA